MFNKKRIIVFLVFLLVMFFMITFAGSSVENAAVATREVIFTDGYNNKDIAKYQVEVGKDVEVPKDPYHKNYVFAGWFDFDNHDIKVTKFTNILADMHVIALYGKDINNNGIDDENDTYYTVTFVNSMTGGVIKTQEVLTGMDATAPKAPNVSGYRFTGWSRSYRNVTADITVNTVYVKEEEKVKTYKVTFIDGDTDEVISVEEVQEGLSATAPTPNEHENRLFSKWEGNYTNVTKNETVTAIYVDDKNNSGVDDTEEMVTITFEAGEHGTLSGTASYELLKGYDKYPAAPEVTASEGYGFKEWNNNYATLKDTVIPMNNPTTTFTAQYDANQYTITFDTDGGTEISAITQDYNTAVTAPADPTKTGYTFAGWDKEIPSTMPAEDMTITASWTINEYTITFDADGGKFSDGTATKEITQDYNTAVTAPAEPTREDYKFSSWDKEVPTTMPAENVTIKATWKDDKNNNDIFDDEETFKVIYKDGETVLKEVTGLKLNDSLTEYTPTKEGYTFKEWAPTWVNTVKAENANASSEIIYTATWTINKYTIKFVNDDGTELQSTEVEHNQMPAYTGNTPTKAKTAQYSYTFAGWTPELAVVTTDKTYTATYTETVNKYNYTVNKYYDDVLNGTETLSADYGTVIQSSTYATTVAHYKVDSATPESITISENEEENVINIYYVSISANIEITTEVSGLDSNGNIEYGQEITYKITIKNTGEDTGNLNAKDKEIAKAIADGLVEIKDGASEEALAIVSSDGLNLVIGPNENKVITVTVIVKANAGDKVSSQISYNVNDEGEKTTDKITVSVEKTISFIQKNETVQGTNIVIVLDKSASMDGNRIKNAKKATKAFINKIFPNASVQTNGSNVTVVTFGTQRTCVENNGWFGACSKYEHIPYANIIGSTATSYSEASTLKTAVDNISNSSPDGGSGTPYYIGLEKAYDILYGTTNLSSNGNKNVLVFLSDGAPDYTDNPTLKAQYISQLHSKGTIVYAIGYEVSSDDIVNLREVSGSDENTFPAGVDDVESLFETISSNIRDNEASTQTADGVAEMGSVVFVDDTHPIVINVNKGTSSAVTHSYTSINSALASGYITYENGKYDVDATKFSAGDTIEVVFFKSVSNTSALGRAKLNSIRSIKDMKNITIEEIETEDEALNDTMISENNESEGVAKEEKTDIILDSEEKIEEVKEEEKILNDTIGIEIEEDEEIPEIESDKPVVEDETIILDASSEVADSTPVVEQEIEDVKSIEIEEKSKEEKVEKTETTEVKNTDVEVTEEEAIQ